MGMKLDKKSKKVVFGIKNLDKIIPRNLKKGLHKSGKILINTLDRNTRTPKSGRIYIINGKKHVSSAPGETWANITYKALRGAYFKVPSSHKLIFGNSGPDYVNFLENGTPRGQMKPRPGHLIAIQDSKTKIESVLTTAVGKSFPR